MSIIENTLLMSRAQLINEMINNDFINNRDIIRELLREMYAQFDDENLLDLARRDGVAECYEYGRECMETERTMRGLL